MDDEVSETVESATVEATGDPTGEPLWGLQWDMDMIDVAEATGGDHYHADEAATLREVFRKIALTLPVVMTQ